MQDAYLTTRDWLALSQKVLAGDPVQYDEALAVLRSHDDDLLGLLHAAFLVRRRYHGRMVSLHVIRNAKSGDCSEDCAYCSQSGASISEVPSYALQSEDELLRGARDAHAIGAVRYCIVTSRSSPAHSGSIARRPLSGPCSLRPATPRRTPEP